MISVWIRVSSFHILHALKPRHSHPIRIRAGLSGRSPFRLPLALESQVALTRHKYFFTQIIILRSPPPSDCLYTRGTYNLILILTGSCTYKLNWRDITKGHWENLNVAVLDFEASQGAITFWAKDVEDLDVS